MRILTAIVVLAALATCMEQDAMDAYSCSINDECSDCISAHSMCTWCIGSSQLGACIVTGTNVSSTECHVFYSNSNCPSVPVGSDDNWLEDIPIVAVFAGLFGIIIGIVLLSIIGAVLVITTQKDLLLPKVESLRFAIFTRDSEPNPPAVEMDNL